MIASIDMLLKAGQWNCHICGCPIRARTANDGWDIEISDNCPTPKKCGAGACTLAQVSAHMRDLLPGSHVIYGQC